jgi:hypothetical protein
LQSLFVFYTPEVFIRFKKIERCLALFQHSVLKKYLSGIHAQSVDLTALSEEAEWLDYFNNQKAKAEELKSSRPLEANPKLPYFKFQSTKGWGCPGCVRD